MVNKKLKKLGDELFDIVADYGWDDLDNKFSNFLDATATFEITPTKKYLMQAKKLLPMVKSYILKNAQTQVKDLEKKFKEIEKEGSTSSEFNESINEARLGSGKEKVYVLNGMLWISYSPNSGQTTRIRGRGWITDKSDSKNFDSGVRLYVKWAKQNKPIKKSKTQKLFKIPEFDGGDAKEYTIWGGDEKPKKWLYLLVATGKKINVITVFHSKAEAMSWIGHTYHTDESVNEERKNLEIGSKGMRFFLDQLINSMEHYDEREFVSHMSKQLKIDPKIMKRVWKNYLVVSPQNRHKWWPKNWTRWLKMQGIVESVNEAKENPIDAARRIVKNSQSEKVGGVLVDMQTANLIVQIYDKVNSSNKKKMEKTPMKKLGVLVWKVAKKARR